MSPNSNESPEGLNDGSNDVSTYDPSEELLEPTLPETPLSKWRMGVDNA